MNHLISSIAHPSTIAWLVFGVLLLGQICRKLITAVTKISV